jgi:hypothetical protein
MLAFTWKDWGRLQKPQPGWPALAKFQTEHPPNKHQKCHCLNQHAWFLNCHSIYWCTLDWSSQKMIMVLHILIFNEECSTHIVHLSQPIPVYNSSEITYSVLSLTPIYVSSSHFTIVFKHPVAWIYYLFHTIYFHLQCYFPLLLTFEPYMAFIRW